MTDCRKRHPSQTEEDTSSSSRNSPILDISTKDIIINFKFKLQQDCSKLYNYNTHKIKWVNEKPRKRKAYEPTEVRENLF